MTKKELAKLAQVIHLHYSGAKIDVVVAGKHTTGIRASLWAFSDGDKLFDDAAELITQFNRPFKNKRPSMKRRGKIPTGRTVAVTGMNGRKHLRLRGPVKMPGE